MVPPLLRVTVSTSDVLKTPGISPFADFLADNDRAIDADNLLCTVIISTASRLAAALIDHRSTLRS